MKHFGAFEKLGFLQYLIDTPKNMKELCLESLSLTSDELSDKTFESVEFLSVILGDENSYKNIEFKNSLFRRAILNGSDFENILVNILQLETVQAVEVHFVNALFNELKCNECDFRNASFSNIFFNKVDFKNSDLSYSYFSNATIANSSLGRIHSARFENTHFIDISFQDVEGFAAEAFKNSVFFNCSLQQSQRDQLLVQGNIIQNIPSQEQQKHETPKGLVKETVEDKSLKIIPKKSDEGRFGALELERKAAL